MITSVNTAVTRATNAAKRLRATKVLGTIFNNKYKKAAVLLLRSSGYDNRAEAAAGKLNQYFWAGQVQVITGLVADFPIVKFDLFATFNGPIGAPTAQTQPNDPIFADYPAWRALSNDITHSNDFVSFPKYHYILHLLTSILDNLLCSRYSRLQGHRGKSLHSR